MKTVYRNARWGYKHFLGIRILSLNEEPNLDASQWGRDLPHCGGRFLTPLWLSQQALHFICWHAHSPNASITRRTTLPNPLTSNTSP
jgi:hypothetical protein